MTKVKLEDVLDETDMKDYLFNHDKSYYEKYCGSCDNFETENCPFKGQVVAETEWKHDTHLVSGVGKKCDKFWD